MEDYSHGNYNHPKELPPEGQKEAGYLDREGWISLSFGTKLEKG